MTTNPVSTSPPSPNSAVSPPTSYSSAPVSLLSLRGFDPVLDGWVIHTTYLKSLENGPANDVPVLVGNNRDEDGIIFSENYTVAEYHTAAVSRYNASWAEVFEILYPANTTAEATAAFDAQLRDQARTSTWSWASRWEKRKLLALSTLTSGTTHLQVKQAVPSTLLKSQRLLRMQVWMSVLLWGEFTWL